MGIVQRRVVIAALLFAMSATAAWRLAHPPLSPREESWLASGYRQVNIGRYGYAYARFRKVLSINASNDEARQMLDALKIYGYLLRKKPSPGTLARYEETRKRYPDSPYVAMIGGELKLAVGDADSAIRLHREAAEAKPDISHNWYGLGMAYRAAGQHEAALEALKRATSGEATVWHYLELGHQLFHARDFDAASRAFRQAYEKSPRFVDARIGELRSLLHAGHYDDAVLAGESLMAQINARSSKMTRRAKRVELATDSNEFELTSGMKLETLKDYVLQLNRWAQDLGSGKPVDISLADIPPQSPLLPVFRLDIALLP